MKSLTEETLNEKYLIIKDLAPDKPYKTYSAMHKLSNGSLHTVILKEMDEKRASVYSALSAMWNPFLSDIYDVFLLTDSENPEKNRFIAVTEYIYADGSPEEECLSLTNFVRKNGPLAKDTALSISVQICEGLKDFHKKGFVHRDLKPDNIMISKYDTTHPSIKIIDFGSAKQIAPYNRVDTTVIGTLGYQPPESLSSHTTRQADIYSIGCILNFMLTGQDPGLQSYQGNHYVASIIEKATNEDPSHRYSGVTAMQKELEHELRTKPLDRIPVLRSVPGFRTHTLWKEIIASCFYITMILGSVSIKDFFSIWAVVEIYGFFIVVPLITLCNMGNLLRFFPERIRRNNRLFFMMRTTITVATFVAPVFGDYLAGRS